MKDLVITGNRLRKEITIFSVCFIVAFIINIISIIKFRTPWHEMFTQIGYVVIISFILYLLLAIVRMIILFVRRLIKISRS